MKSSKQRERAGLGDLMRLGMRVVRGRILNGGAFDTGATLNKWARDIVANHDGASIQLPVGHTELVTSRAESDRILECPVGANGYAPGKRKVKAFSFFVPHALIIADWADWSRLRAFNERVLAGGASHPSAPAFLAAVRSAFAQPVRSVTDVRAAMEQAVALIVLGPGKEACQAVDDARALFDVMRSPLRRAMFGWHRRRRARLFATLTRRWNAAANEPTLLARARQLADPTADPAELLEQVPHWMFTFTGSGAELMTHTLALACARPDVRDRILRDVAAAGALDDAVCIGKLRFVNACLLETGRLFPPVKGTAHSTRDGKQLAQYFPLLQRDDRLGGDVHEFRPERWLQPNPDAAAASSNLFLRGPRACPGADLIMFACTAAIAQSIAEQHVTCVSARLAQDPLPITFPEKEARFATA